VLCGSALQPALKLQGQSVMKKRPVVFSLLFATVLLTAACDERQEADVKGDAREAGQQVERAAEGAVDAVKDAGREVREELRDTSTEAHDTTGH
jgi:predicted small secreted protein